MTMNTRLTRLLLGLLTATLITVGGWACSEDVDPGANNQGETDVIDDYDADAGDSSSDSGDTDVDDPQDVPDDPDVPEEPDGGTENDQNDTELPDLAVDDMRPDRGPIDGGTAFVIEGEGFTDDTVVLFAGNQVETDIVDDDLTGVSPAGDALGPVTVRVIDSLTGEITITEGFTYIEPLHIGTVSPSMLNVEGGDEVTIEGSGFSDNSRVTVAGKSAPSNIFISTDELRFITPPNPAGPATVRVTDSDASTEKIDAVTYVAPVELDGVDPPYGSTDGGDEVEITGSGFDASLDVRFDGISGLVDDIAADGSQATVTTPPGSAGIVDVHAETDDDGAFLTQGFAYLDDSSAAPSLDGIVPNAGSTTGGERVYLVGSFDDQATPQVTFGGEDAIVISSDDSIIAVDTPSYSTAESVDVAVDDGNQVLTKADGYTFFDDLLITTISPDEGPAAGGTSVTVTGAGFDAVDTLRLAGLDTSFTVIDDETIEFSTIGTSHGPADLHLNTDDGRQAVLEDAFFFIEPLELWTFSPTRGAVAGNTYVEVRGTGFTEDTEIFFGDDAATDLEIIDSFTVSVRTPPNASGPVEITAEEDSQDAQAAEYFTYFNPGAQSGGAWGNPIDGAVNVTVFDIMSTPVEDAFVMLSTSADTTYKGLTNSMGQVTLSGPDVLGEQTITATAVEHSSVTVQYVDAENITVFLHPQGDGDPPMQPPPPTATFTGDISGIEKLTQPAPDEILLAIVETTRPSINDDLPDPGGENVVTQNGEYTVQTRIGELALVALGGLYNTQTEEFTPLRMGTARYLTAADGGTYNVDIDLDIPLNNSVPLKFEGAPTDDPAGPNTNQATVYLDLNVDGVFGPMLNFTTTNDIVDVQRLGALNGDLDDATYQVMATSHRNGAAPFSQIFVTGIDDLDTSHSTPPMISSVEFIAPDDGVVGDSGLVQWSLHGIHQPSLYYVYLQTFMGEIVWEIFLPGSATNFTFPDFPDLSVYGLENDDGDPAIPLPYPGGTFSMGVVGFGGDNLSANNFSYDDLGGLPHNGVSLSNMLVGF